MVTNKMNTFRTVPANGTEERLFGDVLACSALILAGGDDKA